MTAKRWVVRADDPRTVSAIVAQAGGDAAAIADGRVFVGRRRAKRGDEAVTPGDEVTIAPPVSAGPDVVLLGRSADLVAVAKPAGMPTIADHAGASQALVARAAALVGMPEARLHPTSRLDREVSGVVVFATTPAAAARLLAAREAHAYSRRYVAVAAAAPEPPSGTWDAPIGRAKDPRHRAVGGTNATTATTHYGVVARAGASALLALSPVTGRTHQLRVHASHAGAPLYGDRVYGGPARVTLPTGRVLTLDRVALHAARVTIPEGAKAQTFAAPIPAALADLWLSLGGDPAAWDRAVSCELPSP